MVEADDKIEVGFSGMQRVRKLQEPEIVLDSGSTISLFKESKMLEEVKHAHTQLLMETNAGTKAITEKGIIPGYGPVWYDLTTVSNIFSLSKMVRRGNHVKYDSNIADEFVVTTNAGKVLTFHANEQGLYTKDRSDSIPPPCLMRDAQEEEDNNNNDDVPPPLICPDDKDLDNRRCHPG